MFPSAQVFLLSVLCYLHQGLLQASKFQQVSSPDSKIESVDSILTRGKQLRDSGHLDEAVAVFRRALSIAESRADLSGKAKTLILLGRAQSVQSHYQAALASLEQGAAIAEQQGNFRPAGAAAGNIAAIYTLMGDWAAAEQEAERSIGFLKQIPASDRDATVLLASELESHADICFHLEKYPLGYQDSDQATSLAEMCRDLKLQALIWDVRGSALVRQRRIPEAEAALLKSLSLAQKANDADSLSFVREHLAELEIIRKDPDWKAALVLIDQALASHAPLFSSSPQYYPIHVRGEILEGLGDRAGALAEFMHAVNIADEWRLSALPGDTTSTQTVAELQSVYGDYAHLAAEIAIDKKDNALAVKALAVLAENRAASLREQIRLIYGASSKLPDEYYFKLAQLQSAQGEVTLGSNKSEDKVQLQRIRFEISELENQTGIRFAEEAEIDEKNSRRNSLSNIQHTLKRDQVLISISLGENQSYIWAVTGERVSLSRLAGKEELQAKASDFMASVRSGDHLAVAAAQFTRALFGGLPPDVWDRSEWMIVSDGALLEGIPFCALKDLRARTSADFLMQSKTLRFLPSELFLLDRPTDATSNRFIGLGDPIYNSADDRLPATGNADPETMANSSTLARLIGSDREVRSAAKVFSATHPILLTGPKATRENLAEAIAPDAAIIHFAVHVVSPPDQPEQAALALSLRNGIPELLTPETIATFHTPGSLVVLSGCSSGQGKVVPGAGLIGLSRAWLLAGASAVVVSSWPTLDDSGHFFTRFYQHLDEIKSGDMAQRAALALRLTQMDMQSGKGYQAAPSFWGAFAVISKE